MPEGATGMKSPAYLAINPMGKVPTIRHGDVVVTMGAGSIGAVPAQVCKLGEGA